MYFALAYYPRIDHPGLHAFRMKYEPYASLMPEHIPFIFPIPEEIGRKKLENHIERILKHWHPIQAHFCKLDKTWDHWLYLGAKEGHDDIIQLHDRLYTDILEPYLRLDLPFVPHIVLGYFGEEAYDVNDPTAPLTFDEKNYHLAKQEFQALHFDVWFTIDRLTLVALNDQFTECYNLMVYDIC